MGGVFVCISGGFGIPCRIHACMKPMFFMGKMTSEQRIRKFAWVLDFLTRRKRATLREINEAWLSSSLVDNREEMPDRRTWYKCFDDISMLCGIDIIVDRRTRKWYIENESAIRTQKIQRWMLSMVSFRNILDDCILLHERVELDGFPSENNRLASIVTAMKENAILQISHARYEDDEVHEYIVAPYFIKSYKRRLYLSARTADERPITLAFDRMLGIEQTGEKFIFPKKETVKEFFFHSYGVMHPRKDMKVERIVVRAWGDAKCYLRDVPLHHTQQELRASSKYADFGIYIYPTNDFIGDIIQQQDRLEILKPQWLREQMKERLKRAIERYK